jgi:hypothetical protein
MAKRSNIARGPYGITRGHTLAWCTLRARFRRGRIAALRTGSPIYSLHGLRAGSRVRWPSGAHRIGRNVAVGVRGHRVRWLACARVS